jgi:phosphoenolpyruvate-protein kinase (PTS system EI component)
LTWVLLGLGVRELSMSPGHLDAVRSVIRGTSLTDARARAAAALAADNEIESEALVASAMHAHFPDALGGEAD